MRERNRVEFHNEGMIAITAIHFIFFTEWIDDSKKQETLGWSMICCVLWLIGSNLIVVFYYTGL